MACFLYRSMGVQYSPLNVTVLVRRCRPLKLEALVPSKLLLHRQCHLYGRCAIVWTARNALLADVASLNCGSVPAVAVPGTVLGIARSSIGRSTKQNVEETLRTSLGKRIDTLLRPAPRAVVRRYWKKRGQQFNEMVGRPGVAFAEIRRGVNAGAIPGLSPTARGALPCLRRLRYGVSVN
eukprot:gene56794-biopygen34473